MLIRFEVALFNQSINQSINQSSSSSSSILSLVTGTGIEFSLNMRPEDVGIYTGATIHTRNGLKMKIKERLNKVVKEESRKEALV